MGSLQYSKIYGHIDDICLLGHGSIGRGVLPLIKRHFTFSRLTIVDPNPVIQPKKEPKITFMKIGLNRGNFK
jgi:homospermidine synthase